MKCTKVMKQLLLLPMIVCIIFCSSCIQLEYEYTELLPPPGYDYAIPVDINKEGVLIGYMFDENDVKKAFIYKEGEYTELLPPGWESASANAINDNGVVVGSGYNDETAKTFIYEDGEYTELLPPGLNSASAYDTNENGMVVGTGYYGYAKGFIYEEGEYIDFLPAEYQRSSAHGVNDEGMVVGWASDGTAAKGFIYFDGAYTELLPPGWKSASANAINENGVVVGGGYTDSDRIVDKGRVIAKGFIYKDGEWTELLPPGWLEPILEDAILAAWDINNNGVVIGGIQPGEWKFYYKYRGFIYEDNRYIQFLPLGWEEGCPNAINDNGVVVGFAKKNIVTKDGAYVVRSGFIATPVNLLQ